MFNASANQLLSLINQSFTTPVATHAQQQPIDQDALAVRDMESEISWMNCENGEQAEQNNANPNAEEFSAKPDS